MSPPWGNLPASERIPDVSCLPFGGQWISVHLFEMSSPCSHHGETSPHQTEEVTSLVFHFCTSVMHACMYVVHESRVLHAWVHTEFLVWVHGVGHARVGVPHTLFIVVI
jgi:hypothetical protein